MTEQFFPCSTRVLHFYFLKVAKYIFLGMIACYFVLQCIGFFFSYFKPDGDIVIDIIPLYLSSLVAFSLFLNHSESFPKGYSISPDGITILRKNNQKVFLPMAGIASIEILESPIPKQWMNTLDFTEFQYFGNGKCIPSKSLRELSGWITPKTLVLVRRTNQCPVVLSPDNKENFLACARQFLPQPPA